MGEGKDFFDKFAVIQATLRAPKGQFNDFGKYHYRSCEDILEAVKPLLNGLVLVISDDILLIGDRHYVKAIATLRGDGEMLSVTAYAREEETKKGMDASQITGSASSYARKYALNGLFLIDDTKDADTQDNTGLGKKAPPPAKQEGNKPPPEKKPEGNKDEATQRKEIWSWLVEMQGGDQDMARNDLESITSFDTKDEPPKHAKGRSSVEDLGTKANAKGQTQLSLTHGKVHKSYNEWKEGN
jgi:hypothetical protein